MRVPGPDVRGLIDEVESLLQCDLNANAAARQRLAELWFAQADALCRLGHTDRVQQWLEALPSGMLDTDPVFSLCSALVLGRAGRYREALLAVEEIWKWRRAEEPADRFRAAGALPEDFDATVVWAVAGFRYHNGRYRQALALIDDYLGTQGLSPDQEEPLRRIAMNALYFLGRYEEAIAAGERLLETCRDRPVCRANTLGTLAAMHVDLCRFARTRELLAEERAVLAKLGDHGMAANSYLIEADIAVWEGDYAKALRLTQQALQMALESGQAYYRAAAILKHADVLCKVGQLRDAQHWLERADCESLPRLFEVQRDASWALLYSRFDRRDLALQRTEAAVAGYGEGPARGNLSILVSLVETVVEADAPQAALLLTRAKREVPLAFPAHRARITWLEALHRYRHGHPAAPVLAGFLALCEGHGLAGLIRQAALEAPQVLLYGLKEGVASALYAAALPNLDDDQMAQVAAVACDIARPEAVRRCAFQLLSRSPDHPDTVRATAALIAAGDVALGEVARRLRGSVRFMASRGPTLEFSSFGGFEVLHQGRSISARWRRKSQILFAMLMVQGPRPLSRSLLHATLWPDQGSAAAANNLRVTLHALRQGLAAAGVGDASDGSRSGPRNGEWLLSSAESISLQRREEISWDAQHLEQFVAVARRCIAEGEEDEAVAALIRAVEIYSGPFLPEPAFDEFFDSERRHYGRLAYDAMVDLAGFSLDRGDLERALASAEAAVRAEPLDEQGHLLVLRAHAAMGYPHRVTEAFQRYRDTLLRETGDKPSEEALRLFLRLTC